MNTIADPIDTEIIRTVSQEAKVVTKITENLRISTSSTYRRLKNLEKQGMIYVERYLDHELGKPSNRYRAAFSHIDIKFNHNETIIEAEPTSKVVEQTYQLFSSLKRGRK